MKLKEVFNNRKISFLLFLAEEKQQGNASKVKVFAQLILNKAFVRFINILRQVTKECKCRRVCRQLCNVFYLNELSLNSRRRPILNYWQQHIIQFACWNPPGTVYINFLCFLNSF